MAQRGTAFLMYHELSLPGRAMCHAGPGYARYVVAASDFRQHMQSFAESGWICRNLSQSLESFDTNSICITFDDGCETDLLCAAPVLKKFGQAATFYITVTFLNQPGYLTQAQVRSLRTAEFEIGCHSMTHAYLTDIDEARLRVETAEAKDRLEQITGAPVEHFSCPGGRWDRRVLEAVKSAGFSSMTTSRTGLNLASTDPFALNRIAVLQGSSAEQLIRTCRGQGLRLAQWKESARDAAKRVLGNSAYDTLRKLVLGSKTDSTSPMK
jgi:peptidoglycan/xylan/chitin deacetylase (PgdA/CDA1 family)